MNDSVKHSPRTVTSEHGLWPFAPHGRRYVVAGGAGMVGLIVAGVLSNVLHGEALSAASFGLGLPAGYLCAVMFSALLTGESVWLRRCRSILTVLVLLVFVFLAGCIVMSVFGVNSWWVADKTVPFFLGIMIAQAIRPALTRPSRSTVPAGS